MTILSITAGLIRIAPPQMAPWVLRILIDLWTIPAHCWMILWSAGCLVIIWFHGALSDLLISWPSWSNGCLFFFTAVYFWFPVGWGTYVLSWWGHAVTSPWEFIQILCPFMLFLPLRGLITCVSRQLLVSSTDPAAYQFRLACAPTPWMGRKKGPDHTDWQTDDLLVSRCQGHPSHFATSAGQIECPSRCSVSVGADSTDRSRFFICSLSGGLRRSTCLPLFPSEAASLHITAPRLQRHTVMLVP